MHRFRKAASTKVDRGFESLLFRIKIKNRMRLAFGDFIFTGGEGFERRKQKVWSDNENFLLSRGREHLVELE
jgi:hypothetical protein